MSKKSGQLFLLKIGDGAMSEAFTTLGGLRSTKLTLNSQEVDSTTVDSSEWKESLDGHGIRHMAISGSGLSDETANIIHVRSCLMSNTQINVKIYDAYNNIYACKVKIKSFEEHGEYNGVQAFSISLESVGAVTFTAGP